MGRCLEDIMTSGIDFWQDLGIFLKPLLQIGKIIKSIHTTRQIFFISVGTKMGIVTYCSTSKPQRSHAAAFKSKHFPQTFPQQKQREM